MVIPVINQTSVVSMGGRTCRRGRLSRTVENRGDEHSGKVGLLLKVQNIWDLWSIGVVGPRLLLRVRHSPDVYGGGSKVREGITG